MRGENEVKSKFSTAVTIYDLQHRDSCILIRRLSRRRRVCGRAQKFLHVPIVTANGSYRSRGKIGYDYVLCMCELRGVADL